MQMWAQNDYLEEKFPGLVTSLILTTNKGNLQTPVVFITHILATGNILLLKLFLKLFVTL